MIVRSSSQREKEDMRCGLCALLDLLWVDDRVKGREDKRLRRKESSIRMWALNGERIFVTKHEIDGHPLVGEELDEDLGVRLVVLE